MKPINRTYTRTLISFQRLVLGALLVVRALGDPPYSTDVWVCNTNNPSGNGTAKDPFDGSTLSKFDHVMNGQPPDCTIHLLSGVYQSSGKGTNGWIIKTGQRIVGTGMDTTTIHLNYIGAMENYIGNTETGGTNIEVRDLTIDCAGTLNYHGLYIFGHQSAIRRVKVQNINSTGEAMGLALTAYHPSTGRSFYSENNVIEECVADLSRNPGSFTAIGLGGGPTQYQSGVVRNNRVISSAKLPGGTRNAINICYSHHDIVEGNFVEGSDEGFYSDSGSNTDMTIINNTFLNVFKAIEALGHRQTNFVICFNRIVLVQTKGNWTSAMDFEGGVQNVVITHNSIQLSGALSQKVYPVLQYGTSAGFVFANNTVDGRLSPPLFAGTGAQVYNNCDLYGGPLAYNLDPAHGVARKTLKSGSAYTLQDSDRYVGIQNGGGPFVIRVPDARGRLGKEWTVAREDVSGNPFKLIIVGTGYEINNSSTAIINKSTSSPVVSTTLVSDGANWWAR